MKNLVALLFVIAHTLNSIGQQTYETINVNGTSRTYYQYLPQAYDPQTEELPILFVLHGLGGSALDMTTAGLNTIADTARFILVYPQGSVNQVGQTSWNNNTLLASTTEDLALISNLIDSLNSSLSIDLSRIYMTGVSMGAIMTYNVSRFMSDRIAAVVCHIGTMSTTDLTNFSPAYPIPTLHKHGTNDGIVPYAGPGLSSLSLVQETIDQLKITNGFLGDSTITTLPDNVADGITVDRIVYNCTTPLELWRMNGAGHVLLFEPLNDTNSIEVTWGFLRQFTHPNPALAETIENKGISPNIFPNPASGYLNLINYYDFSEVSIVTLDGKYLATKPISTHEIDISALDPAIYIFCFVNKNGQPMIQRIKVE